MAHELTLKPGDLAPGFSAVATDGRTIRLDQYAGQNVVLYFYPRDDTPGCTKEACSFRDTHSRFAAKNAVILGVSTDGLKAHEKFAAKYQLPFPLLVDEERAIVTAYGVWGEKTFMGRKHQGTHRVTFLIGPDGRIRKIWPKVKVEGHADEVLAAL